MRKMQSDHSGHHHNNMPLQEEGYGVHARPWQQEMDALHRDIQALHLDFEDRNWSFVLKIL